MTINNSLKIKILYDFLLGIKREVIAKKYGISTGSVSAIVDEFELDIPDIQKIRAMMVKLSAAGNDPKLIYPAIRLHNYIKNLGLTEAQAEYMLEMFQEYAFKNNYDVSALFDSIINAFTFAQKCGTDLEHLDQHVKNRKLVLEAIEALIRKLNNDREIMPYKLNIDLAEFQEYKKNQPLIQNFIIVANELHFEKKVTKVLKDQLEILKSEFYEKEIENEKLKQLLSQQREKEGEEYIDYRQDIVNFDSINLPLDDSNDVDDNIDRS